MTDGEANYGACLSPNGSGVCSNNTSPYRTRPCGQAVTSARQASSAGVWVFGIAYDTPGVGCLGWRSGTCVVGSSTVSGAQTNGNQFRCPEVPPITAAMAVQSMAYDPLHPSNPRYFSSPNPGSLTTLFKSIAAELTEGRLLDDDAE